MLKEALNYINFLLVGFIACPVLVWAGGPPGRTGQVRGYPETAIAYGQTPRTALALSPVKLSESSFLDADEPAVKLDFGRIAAEAAFAYDERNLRVKLLPAGTMPTGTLIVRTGERIARVPLVAGEATLAWTQLGLSGVPTEETVCALDLAWRELDRPTLMTLPVSLRRHYVHTTFSAFAARPTAVALDAHLRHPSDWKKVTFGTDIPETSPTVDGKLNDWDAASFTDESLLGDLLEGRYVVSLATAFDRENLYVAAKFAHPDGKPVNTASAVTGAGYGGGDALQIRLSDGKSHTQSFCAFNAPEGAALTVDTRDPASRNLLARGGRLAFGRWDGGYTVELSIPWKVFGCRAKAGDAWRLTFQPWWYAPTDRFTFLTTLAFARPPAKAVAFENPREGAVSLGVYDGEGRLVRTLLKGEWRANGAGREPWDLKDQFGAFVKPGAYAVRGLVTDGITGVYRYSLGNPGKPAWPTADGRGDWLSDEAPPQAVATDGEIVFVAAPGSEKGFATMAIDRDGNRLWGVGEEFYPRCVSLSYLDGKLYALYSGPVADATAKGAKAGARGRAVIIAYDARTGRHVDFSLANAHTEIGTRWEYREAYTNLYELIREKAFAPENYIGQPRYWDVNLGETDNAIGFAALPGLFAVSKFYDDVIEFYEAKTLRLAGTVAVEKPVGLCRAADGAVLAISGQRVVRIDMKGGRPQPSVPVIDGLVAPVGLCVDRAGSIYVSEWRDRMCVAKFSADGKRLGTIGRRGGRPWIGKFDFGGMLLPHGVAVTDDGQLFVAEADMTPKRISCWDASSGRFLRHWLGPTPYGGKSIFWADPAEPGFYHTSGCKFSFDEKTGASEIVATEIRRLSADDPFVFRAASCMGSGVRVVRRGSEEFIVAGDRNTTVWLRKVGDTYRSCAAVGGLHYMVTGDGTGIKCWDSDIGYHFYHNYRPSVFRGHAGKRGKGGDNFAWSDLNGDGLVQAEELTWHETLNRSGIYAPGVQFEFYTGWGALPAADGTLHWAGFARNEDILWELKPTRWTAFGPVYDINKTKAVHREQLKGGQAFTGVYTASDGSFYAVGAVGYNLQMIAKKAITAFAPDGRMRWAWPASATAGLTDFAASGIEGGWKIPGIGEVLCTWNWWWNFRPYFLTTDGLYVGTFGEETSLGPAALWSESATYYFQGKDGTPYLVNGANQSHHVFEMKGFANARRFSGSVAVTEAELARARADEQIPVRRAPPKPVIALDGNPVSATGGKGRAFSISLARAGERLVVDAEVDDPTPMLQTGTDDRTLFITGDCVDFMFAADPKAPATRREPAAGDKRLLFSEVMGKPVAVLYEPVTAPRAARPHQLMAAKIDRITRLKDAQVKIVRRKDGYRLTASVALSDLGLAQADLSSFRGDVGVIYSGAVGGRELRLYYYNKNTFMTADLTTEATLQPAEWGTIRVPPAVNLIRDPSFESGDGWEKELVPADSRVVADGIAHTGRKSLLIETPSHVSVGQTVKIPPGSDGRTVRFRLFWRAEGLEREIRRKEGNVYAALSVWLAFRNAKGKVIRSLRAYHTDRDFWEWQPIFRPDTIGPTDAVEAEIPAGTDNVRIDFKITVKGLERTCRLWLDSAEFSL